MRQGSGHTSWFDNELVQFHPMISLFMSELLTNHLRKDVIVSFRSCVVEHIWNWHVAYAGAKLHQCTPLIHICFILLLESLVRMLGQKSDRIHI